MRGAQAESGPQQGVAPGQRRTCMAHGQWPRPKVEVEAHAQRVLCILMPRRHRHLELLNLGHGPATGTGSQAEPGLSNVVYVGVIFIANK